MNKKKFLFCCVVCMAVTWNVFAQSPESDFETKEEGGSITITKYLGWDTELVIPAEINGKPVTVIGEKVFQKTGLTSLTLPEGLKLISAWAFSDNKLTTVSIPSSVTRIEKYAFYNNQLTSVTFGSGVAYIGDSAFWGNKLTSITIPDNVLEIDGSFGGNPLTSVTLGNGLVFVDQPLGYNIPKTLTSLTLNANINADLISVHEKAFYDYICNDRQAGTYTVDTNWDKSRATKREGDFAYIETDYGVVIIRMYGREDRVRIPAAFNGKPVKAYYGSAEPGNRQPFIPVFQEITNVFIPDGVTYIGHAAFYRNKLSTLKIPDSVTYIGAGAFTGGIWEPGYSNSYSKTNSQVGHLTSLTLPGKLAYIGAGAFAMHKIAGNLVIPDTVTDIGDSAFAYNDLSGVTFGKGLTRLGPLAFASNQLTSVAIPAGITDFGESVFTKNQLISVTIAPGVKTISGGTFSSNQLTGITIPPGVETIGDEAFSSNQLESIVIPDSVTYLGSSAFAHNKLKSLTLGKGITFINDRTFASNELKDVTIPNGVTGIDTGAFLDNGTDRTITLPASITYIGSTAFAFAWDLVLPLPCIKTLVIGSNVEVGMNGLDGMTGFYNNGKKGGRYTLVGRNIVYSEK